jgi:hypothetical protein
MEDNLIKKKEGAVAFRTKGENLVVVNWKEGKIEIWKNERMIFSIDMN